MLVKIASFFREEYISTEKYLKTTYAKGNERMVVEKAISRCLGVAQFSQRLGVAYEDVEPMYNYFKKQFENLLDR